MTEIKIVPLNDDSNERLKKVYPTVIGDGQEFIRTKPGNCFLPGTYKKYKDRIQNFQLRDDDVFVLSWPKNGTTRTQEMVWCMMNQCDFQKAKTVLILIRVPCLEFISIFDVMKEKVPDLAIPDTISIAENILSPRVIKSHLPYCLLPDNILDQCKVVTCLRNPKDVVVSYFHFEKLMKVTNFEGTFAEYFDLFMDDLVLYSSYWEHTLEVWRRKDHPNLCLLFFEDMKKDLEGCIRKVAKFLQKDLTEDQFLGLADHLSFKKMKETGLVLDEKVKNMMLNTATNTEANFFRKGEVGDWKNFFTDDMNKRMDEKIQACFGGTGLEFRYE